MDANHSNKEARSNAFVTQLSLLAVSVADLVLLPFRLAINMIGFAATLFLIVCSLLCSAFASLLDCYNFYAGYYLLRSGNVIIPHVESVDSCLQKCANAEELYGFICRSVMVENKRNNCVLSKWDRLSRPDRFMRSNKFHINYYERICDLEQELMDEDDWTISTLTTSPVLRSQGMPSDESQENDRKQRITARQDIRPTHTDIIGRKAKISDRNVMDVEAQSDTKSISSDTSFEFTLPAVTLTLRPNYDNNRKADIIGVHSKIIDANANIQHTEIMQQTDPGTIGIVRRPNPTVPTRHRSFDSAVQNSAVKAVGPNPQPNRIVQENTTSIGDVRIPNRPTISISHKATDTVAQRSPPLAKSIAIRPGPVTTHPPIRRPAISISTSNSTNVVVPVPSSSSETDERVFVLKDYSDEEDAKKSSSQKTLKKIELSSSLARRKIHLKNAIDCFKQTPHAKLLNYDEESITSSSVDDCLRRCLHSTTFICLSVNYDRLIMICTLNGGSVYLNDAKLTPSSRVVYYENICSPGVRVFANDDDSNDSRKDGSSQSSEENTLVEPIAYNLTKLQECFTVRENAVLYDLNGFVDEKAESLAECLLACGSLRSTQNTPCYSLNWFKQSRRCFIHATHNEITSLRYSPTADFYLNSCFESDFTADTKASRGDVNNTDYYDDGTH